MEEPIISVYMDGNDKYRYYYDEELGQYMFVEEDYNDSL